MYNNSGAKVKGVATTITVLTIIFSVMLGLFVMIESFLSGLLVIAFGCVGAWLSGLLLAAFGELVENSHKILQIMSKEEPLQASEAKVQTDVSAYVATDVSRAEINAVMQRDGVPYGEAMLIAKREKAAACSGDQV